MRKRVPTAALKSLKPRFLAFVALAAVALTLSAQELHLLRPHNMGRWGIPAGNYSGIAPLGNGRYALVSDKQEGDGWIEVAIDFASSGDISRMQYIGQHIVPTPGVPRDAEGIVAIKQSTAATDGSLTLFVCAESDQRIIELDALGRATGRELTVPEAFSPDSIFGNYGFEALAYHAESGRFWITTEQGLRRDADRPSSPENPVPALLRLQSFDAQLQPAAQYAYRTEPPTATHPMRLYAFGVPEMTALPDGSLLVLEREVAVRPRFDGSFVKHRLFSIHPGETEPLHLQPEQAGSQVPLSALPPEAFVEKRLVGEFTTRLKIIGRKDLANYEGMCIGPTLPDGRQTLIFVADSQNRMGNALFRLKDYIRVAIINQ